MEIKEQIAKEIFEYDFTGFNPKWAECANKSHWLNLANKIIELFEQANPIQAGEDGLAKNPYKEQLPASQAEFDAAKQRYEEAKKFYGKEADRGEFDTFREQLRIDGAMARTYDEGTRVQKALDDARILQVTSTDTIEFFIDGKKTVFITELQAKQKQAEAVKKVFDGLEDIIIGCDEDYNFCSCLYNDKYEAFKKQTLEELEEK